MNDHESINFFSGNPLNKKGHERHVKKLTDKNSRCLVFVQDTVLLRKDIVECSKNKEKYKIDWKQHCHLEGIASQVYLGEHPLLKEDIWAVELSAMNINFSKDDQVSFEKIRPNAFLLSREEGAIVAQARALLDWHARYKFCPSCATETEWQDGGYKRMCKNLYCIAHQSVQNFSHPRTDAVVIMCIVSEEGRECLLGRQSRWPKKLYSCIAGFIEPGETLEYGQMIFGFKKYITWVRFEQEAARRESLEETGILIGKVDYVMSQPWPFPSQLMLGCVAYAKSREVSLMDKELEDARWFDIKTLQNLLYGEDSEDISLPPDYTIAHQLIVHVCMKSNKL